MASSTLKLPGPYAEGTSYVLSGKTLNEIFTALQADRVIPGPGQTESQTPQGRIILGGSVGEGAVCYWRPSVDTETDQFVLPSTQNLYESHETMIPVDVTNQGSSFGFGWVYLVWLTPISGVDTAEIEVFSAAQDLYETDTDPDTDLEVVIKSRTLLFHISKDVEGNILLAQQRCTRFVLSERCLQSKGPAMVFESIG